MALKLFNTLTRSVEEFTPLDPSGKRVGMYCCGPTVYDVAHIGNFRTFVFADLVRRYLEFKGFSVRHVMNITDVEDKIIARVREANIPLREFRVVEGARAGGRHGVLAESVGRGASRLAHRVQRDEHETAGAGFRSAPGRRRPGLSAS